MLKYLSHTNAQATRWRKSVCERIRLTTLWSTTLSLKVNLHHAINFRALSCAAECLSHTVECDPFMKSHAINFRALCGANYVVQTWSRDPQFLEGHVTGGARNESFVHRAVCWVPMHDTKGPSVSTQRGCSCLTHSLNPKP